jgi:hypothetical protein
MSFHLFSLRTVECELKFARYFNTAIAGGAKSQLGLCKAARYLFEHQWLMPVDAELTF